MPAPIEVSGTVDEESGGFAGVAWLAEHRLSSRGIAPSAVIIPEPFGVDRVCVGHRGVYWFEVVAHGRIAHGSMPYLGRERHRGHVALPGPGARRAGAAAGRRASPPCPWCPKARAMPPSTSTASTAGRPSTPRRSPCVADLLPRRVRSPLPARGRARPHARRDRRAGGEGRGAHAGCQVHDRRPPDLRCRPAPRTTRRWWRALTAAIQQVVGRPAAIVASPGTYDHKHVARIAGVPQCVAYGPGDLVMAHQPDEYCSVDDIVTATKVLAIAVMSLAE